jgi:glycosyltransferase involved in cell wall biosynthesis
MVVPPRAAPERPRLAMVSTWIRRDLQDPLRFFRRLDVRHFYRIQLGDLPTNELGGTIRYGTPVDLYRQLERERPDIIQGVEPLGLMPLPYVLVGWRFARRHGLPWIVVSLENRPLETKYGRAVATVLRSLLRPYLRGAALVVHLNEGTRRNLSACGAPADRMRRLMWGTWGVDVDEFAPEGPVAPTGFRRTILFVGRLIAAKGVFDLLEGFRLLAGRFPETGLVFVGGGPEAPELERRARAHGLADRIVVRGSLQNRDLPPVFRAATVFASPSITTRMWEEQVGMTNIQAMACARPVVSTWSGAIPEYVVDGQTGILVPESAPAALAEAIWRLLGDERAAANLGLRARAHAEAHYDARRNIAEIEDVVIRSCWPDGER